MAFIAPRSSTTRISVGDLPFVSQVCHVSHQPSVGGLILFDNKTKMYGKIPPPRCTGKVNN